MALVTAGLLLKPVWAESGLLTRGLKHRGHLSFPLRNSRSDDVAAGVIDLAASQLRAFLHGSVTGCRQLQLAVSRNHPARSVAGWMDSEGIRIEA